MEWTQDIIDKLQTMFTVKHHELSASLRTDRKNLSAHWNLYLQNLKVVQINDVQKGKKPSYLKTRDIITRRLIECINFQNEAVSNGLVLTNPDRQGQLLIVSRDVAERILVFGMI